MTRTEDEITILATGVANVASVAVAFERLGFQPTLTNNREAIESARRLVLPGVGSFGAAMAESERNGWTKPLQARFRAGRATLAICLGMQLLCRSSAEAPGVGGLGVVDGDVVHLPRELRTPQMGWNLVSDGPQPGGYAYFANSLGIRAVPADWSCSYYEYGGRFVAAMQRGAVWACQFHPELSGKWGQSFLRAWCAQTGAEVVACS